MRVGICTYTYAWAIGMPGFIPARPMSVYSLLGRAAELKVACVQIADNLPLTGFSTNELEDIRTLAKKLKICIEVGGRGLTDENLQSHIDLASFFGSPMVRMVIDGIDYEPDMDTILSVIRNAAQQLKNRGIVLALENHDRLHASTFREIVDRSGSEFTGICLDCVNSLGIGEGIETVLDYLAPCTVNLHVKDFTVRRVSHKMGFVVEGAPAGKGFLNLPLLLEKIIPYGRCGSAILELWTPPAAGPEETIKRENDWAVESIRYMLETIPK
jgi:3-oxoisoapionate decarboxylase